MLIEPSSNRLDPDNASEEEKDPFYVCSVCTMVAVEPVECDKCDNVFCKECIDQWF